MIEVMVTRKWWETAEVAVYELEPIRGNVLPEFDPGAHIDVHISGGYIRQYSLCSASQGTQRYEIAVLREPESRGGSIALQDKIAQGDHLTISAPRNNFPLIDDAAHTVLLAGGIGVTPLLCMAEELSRRKASFRVHYCTRSIERTAFLQRIKHSAFAPQTDFHFDDGAPEQQLKLKDALGVSRQGVHLYVCGPTGFLDYVFSSAKEFGWPEERVHVEYFKPSNEVHAAGETFQVEIASTGQILTVAKGQSVANALEEAGIEIELSCEEGICGTCVTAVLGVEGEVDHRDMYLSSRDHRENRYFTPCCSRLKAGGKIVLDI